MSSSTIAPAELAADLLAAIGDLERRPPGPPPTRARPRRPAAAGPNSVGNMVRQPSGSVDLAVHHRARQHPLGVAAHRRGASAARATSGSAWMPGIHDGAPVARRVLEPHGVSPRATGRPAGRWTASRSRGAGRRSGDLASSIGRRWPCPVRRRGASSARWRRTIGRGGRARPSVRSLTYDHSSSISSPSSVSRRVGVERAIEAASTVVPVPGGHGRSLRRGRHPERSEVGLALGAGDGCAPRRTMPAVRPRRWSPRRRSARAAEERLELPSGSLVPGSRIRLGSRSSDAGGLVAVAGRLELRRRDRGWRGTARAVPRRESSAPSSATMDADGPGRE